LSKLQRLYFLTEKKEVRKGFQRRHMKKLYRLFPALSLTAGVICAQDYGRHPG